MDRAIAVLQEAGIKPTHQRMEIYREIARSVEHPDAETIYRRVRGRIPTVSLDTVYRALWVFVEKGLITTVNLPDKKIRFDANIAQHHHFVCRSCGLIRDFDSEEFNFLSPPDQVNRYGTAESSHVEFRGICSSCAPKIGP